MSNRVPVVVLLVIGVATGAIAVSAIAAPTPPDANDFDLQSDEVIGNQTNATNASTPTLGSQMSAFMQSSAVSANASVENGMWNAGMARANTSAAQQAVERRTAALERRLDRLEAGLAGIENESLDVRHPGSAATVATLAARMQALEASINETEQVARDVGGNATRLETLRHAAANVSGHRVARMARNLTAGPPAGVPGGPPMQPGNSNGSPGHGSGGPPGMSPPGSQDGAEQPNGTTGPGHNGPTTPTGNETTPTTTNETEADDGSGAHRGPGHSRDAEGSILEDAA